MGRVKAFTISGYEIFFNSDDHPPPHIHVRKPGHWMIKVAFLLCTPERLEYEVVFPPNPRIPASAKRELLEQVLRNKRRLFAEWEAKVCTK